MTTASVLATPFVLLVRGYQRFVSPLLPARCRYYPTCSAYGITALRRFGPLRGGYLTLHRLLRCHPWSNRVSGGVIVLSKAAMALVTSPMSILSDPKTALNSAT